MLHNTLFGLGLCPWDIFISEHLTSQSPLAPTIPGEFLRSYRNPVSSSFSSFFLFLPTDFYNPWQAAWETLPCWSYPSQGSSSSALNKLGEWGCLRFIKTKIGKTKACEHYPASYLWGQRESISLQHKNYIRFKFQYSWTISSQHTQALQCHLWLFWWRAAGRAECCRKDPVSWNSLECLCSRPPQTGVNKAIPQPGLSTFCWRQTSNPETHTLSNT